MARLIKVNVENSGELRFAVEGAGEFVFNPGLASEEVKKRALVHGFVQKISDGAALGKDATAGEKFERMKGIKDGLERGEWNLGRVGGGKMAGGMVVEGMIRAKVGGARDVDEVNALLAKVAGKKGVDRDGAIKLFAGTVEVMDAVAAIKREKAAKSGRGVGDLLDGLGDDE